MEGGGFLIKPCLWGSKINYCGWSNSDHIIPIMLQVGAPPFKLSALTYTNLWVS